MPLFLFVDKNKKGGINSSFFAPNLTMNLTYLCSGRIKVQLLVNTEE